MTEAEIPACRIHATALIEPDVSIGNGSSVWDNVHIRRGAHIGRSCIIGEKTYIAYDVRIGDYCKLNANVYVCAGVTLSDYVMLAAHTVFTNDRFPRAYHISLDGLATSDPTEETLSTHVGTGVTTGANVTIGPGLTIGDFAMIGMGAVVTKDVPAHALVIGNPGKVAGYVCTCGPVIAKLAQWQSDGIGVQYHCARCGRVFRKSTLGVEEIGGVKRH
jgi:UDP-2-acetamido-3-amino-2,3-dideoxy-glucuronate N-acetyltransferase